MAADPVWLCVESSRHQGQTKVGTPIIGKRDGSPEVGKPNLLLNANCVSGLGQWTESWTGKLFLLGAPLTLFNYKIGVDGVSTMLVVYPCLFSSCSLLESAMSGKYLHDGFTLPCPPGLKIPEEDGYTITPNTLKVQRPKLQHSYRTVLGDCSLVLLQLKWEMRDLEDMSS